MVVDSSIQKKIITHANYFPLNKVTINFSKRKTIALHVHGDGSIEIRAPYGTHKSILDELLESKKKWLENKRTQIKKRQDDSIKWQTGELISFLGKKYQLEIIPAKKNKVELLSNKKLVVSLADFQKNASQASIRTFILADFKKRSFDYFVDRTQFWIKKLHTDYAEELQIQIRLMSSRWGSCSSNKSIRLNVLLVLVPIECIDYVIVHELCHWQVFNHSRKFYKVLDSVLPDRKIIEKRLRQYEYLLLEARQAQR